MTAKPVNLGIKYFASKKNCILSFKYMLNKYALKENLIANDKAIVLALLNFHPEAKQKIGVGIEAIYVDTDESILKEKELYHTPGRCFWIKRKDNSYEAFSFYKCIDNVNQEESKQIKPDISGAMKILIDNGYAIRKVV